MTVPEAGLGGSEEKKNELFFFCDPLSNLQTFFPVAEESWFFPRYWLLAAVRTYRYSTTTINQWFVLARQTDNNALSIISSHVDCCVETRTAEMGVPNLYRWLSERCTPPVVRPILPPQHASSGDLSHPLYFPTDAPFPSPCPPRLFTRSAH